MPRVQVALHLADQHGGDNGGWPAGAAGEFGVGRTPRPLLYGAQHHHEVVAVVDKVIGREDQHLGNAGIGSSHQVQYRTVGGMLFSIEQA